MNIETVQKILSENRYLAVSFAGMPKTERDKIARQICQLFEPKHLGKAEFKTAFVGTERENIDG